MNTFVAIVLVINVIYLIILSYTTIDDWKKIGFSKNDIPTLLIVGLPLLINTAVCIAVMVE